MFVIADNIAPDKTVE